MFENDYGKKELGISYERMAFYPALIKLVDNIHPFWIDDYLNNIDKLQKDIKKHVDNVNPDIVFFSLYTNQFSYETLDYLKKKYTTVNWFGDDQWRFDNFTKYYAPHLSYSITTDKFSLKKYEAIGYDNVIHSQWASFDLNENINFDDIQYTHDVSFIGKHSAVREWVIRELHKKNIRVNCMGAGWPSGRVDLKVMKQMYKNSKINLNLSNSKNYDIRCIFSSPKALRQFTKQSKNREQIKARHFEIPAFGGFQLSNYVPFLEDYLDIGKEIAVYNTIDDLERMIKYYLGNESERKKIMINGYKKTCKADTYYHRLNEIINIIL